MLHHIAGRLAWAVPVLLGVSVIVFSFCVHFSDPGATPGQRFTVCAETVDATTHDRAIAKRSTLRIITR